jgi:hypothetical protein
VKKIIILVAILTIGFLSCKKEKAQSTVESETLSIENATMIVAGSLAFSSETNSGTVKVYKQRDGKYILTLENLNLKVSRPSFVIYLSQSEIVSPSSIKICSVGKLNGNISHALPAHIDFTVFKYLIIQTEHSDEFIASAELR